MGRAVCKTQSCDASMHGQPAILAPRQLARTVKMHWLPGARMAPPGARAQEAVPVDIFGPVRARARVSRSKFHKIWAPQCQNAVKMGTWSVVESSYCQTEVLGMQSMRRRRHARIHDLKSRYVENIHPGGRCSAGGNHATPGGRTGLPRQTSPPLHRRNVQGHRRATQLTVLT